MGRNGHVTDRLVKMGVWVPSATKDERMASPRRAAIRVQTSVGSRGNQVLSLTICKRLLRDVRCLEVTQARCIKCESVDFMQLQDLCVCVFRRKTLQRKGVLLILRCFLGGGRVPKA